MTQPILPLFRTRRPALTPGERLLRKERLLAYLAGHGWVRRRQIEIVLGLDDRTIRDIAEESDELISGNRGYKLFAEATPEEIREMPRPHSLSSRENDGPPHPPAKQSPPLRRCMKTAVLAHLIEKRNALLDAALECERTDRPYSAHQTHAQVAELDACITWVRAQPEKTPLFTDDITHGREITIS